MNGILKSVTIASLLLVLGFLVSSSYDEFVRFGGDRVPPPLQAGTVLPEAVVYAENGTARPYTAFTDRALPASLVIFNAVCSSCSAEAFIWDSLATSLAGRMTILAIACTPDRAFGPNLRQSSGAAMEILRCDDSFPKSVGATGLPTVYVISPEREILYSDAGPGATASLVAYLRDWITEG